MNFTQHLHNSAPRTKQENKNARKYEAKKLYNKYMSKAQDAKELYISLTERQKKGGLDEKKTSALVECIAYEKEDAIFNWNKAQEFKNKF
jgi:hypothetical protein